jgi:hypothetical protein
VMRRIGSAVRGRGPRSGRHQSRNGWNRPAGVLPSPSRLLVRMPERPSVTGIALGPAINKPRLPWPGRRRTSIVAKVPPRLPCILRFPWPVNPDINTRLLFYARMFYFAQRRRSRGSLSRRSR